MSDDWICLTPNPNAATLCRVARHTSLGWIVAYGYYYDDDTVEASTLHAPVDLTDAELAILLRLAKGEDDAVKEAQGESH